MKKSIYLFLLCIAAIGAQAQRVSSSCILNDTILHDYRESAASLAVEWLVRSNSPLKDSVHIPNPLKDSLLRALHAIHNAQVRLLTCDTLVRLKLRDCPDYDIHALTANMTQYNSWAGRWAASDTALITGIHPVDSLILKYDLKRGRYWDLSAIGFRSAELKSVQGYNMFAMKKRFEAVRDAFLGFTGYMETNGCWSGTGNDITVEDVNPNFIQLKYYYGWGDCPAGCIFQHEWQIRVYNDCSVERISSTGSPVRLPTSKDEDLLPKNLVKAYPNPMVNQQLTLEFDTDAYPQYELEWYLPTGQLVKKQSIAYSQKVTLDCSDLPDANLYFLKIRANQSVISTLRLIKF
jgi:hypothetical protein